MGGHCQHLNTQAQGNQAAAGLPACLQDPGISLLAAACTHQRILGLPPPTVFWGMVGRTARPSPLCRQHLHAHRSNNVSTHASKDWQQHACNHLQYGPGTALLSGAIGLMAAVKQTPVV